MNARDLHPIERLRVSNHAYSPKHVNNIAQHLANYHKVPLPYHFPNCAQNVVADWIEVKFGYDRELIRTAEQIVRDNYASKQKIYRKGRPIGSKNRNKYYSPEQEAEGAPELDAIFDPTSDVEGRSTFETPSPLKNGTSEASTRPSVDPAMIVRAAQDMLAAYVRKSELEPQINRIGHEVNKHMREHNDAIRSYCESNFTKIFDKVNNIELHKPTIVTLERKELPPIELGVQHRNFPELLSMCNARTREGYHLNVWIYGPAGTGKTTAAKFVAAALTPGRFFALPALETGFQVLGYKDAHGTYQTTLFRECWQNGGTIILDEIDSYSPSAALALNGALANGIASFPDGMIPRHKDCIIIAGANTTGLGGTIEYVGRMKQDAAFLDRWCPLDWPIDEALEDSLCANKEWLAIVRHCRAQIIAKQIKGAMCTPRATIYGESLLAAGLKLDRVIASTIKKGMTDAQWVMIKPTDELLASCVFGTIEVVQTTEIVEIIN